MSARQTSLDLLDGAPPAPADPVERADPNAPVAVVGEVIYVIFSNAESGFRVLRVRHRGDDGKNGTVVAGRASPIRVGDRVRAVGRWKRTKHGLQLEADSIVTVDAVTTDGLARSLEGLVPGLGPARAHRFVESLGGPTEAIAVLDQVTSSILAPVSPPPAPAPSRTDDLDLLSDSVDDAPAPPPEPDPDDVVEARRLVSDPSTLIGCLTWMPLRVRVALVLAWRRSRVEREVEARLASLELSPALRARLVARYGVDAARVVLEEPYRLPAEIDGVGFVTADDVALKVGVGVDSADRIDAAVVHVLRDQAEDGGHTVCSVDDLTKALITLFMTRRPPMPFAERGAECVRESVERALEKGRVARGPGGGYCLPYLLRAEREVADGLARLLATDRPALELSGTIDPSLTDEQQFAVRSVFERGVGVITGGPGCGKTHTCKEIVRVARSLGLHVSLCAPTARAAKRLSEMTDGEGATTIHRMLEARGTGEFVRNANNPIAADLVVADESSMIHVELMAAMVSAVDPRARLLLVGDANQLPPVGPGAPFRDVIASGAVPVARLTKIHRQAAGSAIVRVAHGVLQGAAPAPSPQGDRSDGCVHFVNQPVPEEAARLVVRIVLGLREQLGVDPWEAMVISPMRKGACGVAALNDALQLAMNPPRDDLPEVAYGRKGRDKDGKEEEVRRVFRKGDRVRQTKNDYDRGVVNGDVGRICEIYPEKGRPRGAPWLDVDFPGVGVVHYDGGQLNHLVLAYCSTVHANQGSESPAVVLALVDQHFVMLTRTLLYTAVTRAKRACLVVGSRRALETAARNARDDKRRTALPRLLAARSRTVETVD